MLGKVSIVLAAVVTLTGALSADAFARGSPVGPMGQVFGGVNPADHPRIFARPGQSYGWAGLPHARPRKKVTSH